MKKLSVILAFLCVILLFSSSFAFAANNVSKIDIDVKLNDDGSAYIVQNWQGVFEKGTENYIPINTKGIAVRDLIVSDEYGRYANVSDWDTSANFDEKARHCGILKTDDGVELCFGISNYGEKRYAIEYIVDNFIKAYTDYDGTNFMLVNRGMNTFPTDCNVSIVTANGTKLTVDNAAIWGFGYEGQVEFKDGAVVAYSTKALNDDNYLVLLLRLDKGILSPTVTKDVSFEEIKKVAFEGSDYDNGNERHIFTWFFYILLIFVIIYIIRKIIRKMALKKFEKSVNYFRSIPNGNSLPRTFFLANEFDISKKESLIIGATLLGMINRGELITITSEDVGVFGKVKKSISLKLAKMPTDATASRLYSMLEGAAGEDGILQEKELEKYTYSNYEGLQAFIDSTKLQGESEFVNLGGFTSTYGNKISDLSKVGKTELAEVMGFKKYLEDFSLIAEREIVEVSVWKDYMVYAMLLDIADTAKEQFKKVYPDKVYEYNEIDSNVFICYGYYIAMNRSYTRAINAKRNAGGGGSSSLGGGGGFSGGGFGGGSR